MPLSIQVISATLGQPRAAECMASWGDNLCRLTIEGMGIIEAYQTGYERSAAFDIVAYLHDDVLIYDTDWIDRVLPEFDDPKVGVVGFGGAIQHGDLEIYRKPYRLQQLGRFGYRSNTRDAETHGERFKGECDVATVDGFAIIVRRSLLNYTGGWPIGSPVGYVGYDYWITLMAKRFGYKVRLVGIDCSHLGGLTAVKAT